MESRAVGECICVRRLVAVLRRRLESRSGLVTLGRARLRVAVLRRGLHSCVVVVILPHFPELCRRVPGNKVERRRSMLLPGRRVARRPLCVLRTRVSRHPVRRGLPVRVGLHAATKLGG